MNERNCVGMMGSDRVRKASRRELVLLQAVRFLGMMEGDRLLK
ncbi:hypothetical protein [Aphanizomenon flos-aquae]|nr:hypothetical protein [Aphanizomenon flos-aquae]